MAATMTTRKTTQATPSTKRASESEPMSSFERHLVFDHVVSAESSTPRQRFESLAMTLRDAMTPQWLKTQEQHAAANPKRVYYLSMEFLIGRVLVNNVVNMQAESLVQTSLGSMGEASWRELIEEEPDAGLGNGGLGRLAACFIDSLATLDIPAMGYGLRYDYGIFRQSIENGRQVEQPDHWLAHPDPWEVPRPDEAVLVPVACQFQLDRGVVRAVRGPGSHIVAMPYDRPVVGYGGHTINTLRLWRASSPDYFDFREFSGGDFVGAVVDRILAETVTRVLYPDDSTVAGQALRFLQEYFLVCSSLGDALQRFRKSNSDWSQLSEKVAIQLNDTHPAMAVAELMRRLVDEALLPWETAWSLTIRTLAYTNHTLLPEALEKWPVHFFELVCPRLLELIYEINRRFLEDVRSRFPGDEDRAARMSLIDEHGARLVRMANLAIVGSHSVNGVAKIHSELLRTRVVSDFADMYPERFNNKTNGVTPRRWIQQANPDLSRLLTANLGDAWVTDLGQLAKLKERASDAALQAQFIAAKLAAKTRFVDWLRKTTGQSVDPTTLFDSQIKRIHEYKRQLLNILHVVVLYSRLRDNPSLDVTRRTFFFAGKAAPAYRLAKVIIQLINNVARTIDADPQIRDRLKVIFLPNYNVSLAERLIPATDLSEQISTAGYEASGTGNMKFMMNGALTIGTRDGATIEMAEEAGEENFFLFGLTADQVAETRPWYNPGWHYENEPETRRALDLVFSNHFSPDEPGAFDPIRDSLLTHGDYFMHLADLSAYTQAQQRVANLFKDQKEWTRRAIINVATSGRFSSDRTIEEYAADIWGVSPFRADDAAG
jgi:starch phosphorylase